MNYLPNIKKALFFSIAFRDAGLQAPRLTQTGLQSLRWSHTGLEPYRWPRVDLQLFKKPRTNLEPPKQLHDRAQVVQIVTCRPKDIHVATY